MGRGDRRRRWVRSTTDEVKRYGCISATSQNLIRRPAGATFPRGEGKQTQAISSCHVPTRGFSRWRNDVRRIVASLTAKLASPAEAGKAARKRGRSPDRTQRQHPVSQSVVFMGTGLEALAACLPQIIHTCPHDLPHPIDTAICVLRWPPAQ